MNDHSSTHPRPRIFGVAVVLAPILFLLSDVAYISAGGGVNDGVLGGTIGVWSCFVFAFAFVGIARVIESVSPRGATVLLAVAMPGFVAGSAFNAQAIHLGYFGEDFVNTVSEGSDLIGLLAFLPWGWFGPLSFVVAGILVWRTQTFPRWNAILLVAGGILFISTRPIAFDPGVMIADVTLALAVIPIGVAMIAGARRPAPAAGVALGSRGD